MSGWVAGAIVVAGATSAYMSSEAAKSAASTQAAAADRATAAAQAGLTSQQAINAPFVDTGTAALNKLSTQAAYAPAAFDYNQNTDPGTQFRLTQGLNAMNATAAARGGLISGNALKAGQDYGQAQGSQEYQNAFNRYLTTNAQNLQAYNTNTTNLQYQASLGQAAGANQAANIGNATNAMSSNIIGAGNANAAGQVGAANAYTSALGTGIGQYQMNNLINRSAYSNPTSSTSAPVYDYSTPYQP